jgi:hypothetical protein
MNRLVNVSALRASRILHSLVGRRYATTRFGGIQSTYVDYVSVPAIYNQPEYHPAIYDQEFPHAGVPGHHYNPTQLPLAYSLYWGKGEKEIPIMTSWTYGHQYNFWEMLTIYLATTGAIFFTFMLSKYFVPNFLWWIPANLGPTMLMEHDMYLARGGNPDDPIYQAQLAKEKALLEEGKKIARQAH